MAKVNPLNPMVNGVPDWIAKLIQPDDPAEQNNSPEDYINQALSSLSSIPQDDPTQAPSSPMKADISQQVQAGDMSKQDAEASGLGGAELGLGSADLAAYQWIQSHESGGRTNATNPTSGAFGRAQLLPSNLPTYAKLAGVSNPRTTNPVEQDKMMLAYIKQRYGSPTAAQDFWKRHGWY